MGDVALRWRNHHQLLHADGRAGVSQFRIGGCRNRHRNHIYSRHRPALKENIVTLDYEPIDGFLTRYEWRRDFSNQAFFLTDQVGVRKKEQNTATVGLVRWMGRKQGSW
jgi:hypothetical protein